MDEAELEQELAQLGQLHRWKDHLRKAWILIALGRFRDAIAASNLAWEAALADVFDNERGKREVPIAQAVAYLGLRRWQRVKDVVAPLTPAIPDGGIAQYLYELALQGQGKLHSINPLHLREDPAGKLAAFDAREWAMRELRRLGPREPEPKPWPPPEAFRPEA